jgi:hypothetical protein
LFFWLVVGASGQGMLSFSRDQIAVKVFFVIAMALKAKFGYLTFNKAHAVLTNTL